MATFTPTILDLTKPQAVTYCVDMRIRDQQIRLNAANVKGRIQQHQELRTDALAIVCYGPSLNDTWEQVKDFKFVMTTSGAHRFMIDKGIVPTWHVDVDPRPHKITLLGDPHPDVEYLLASTCHPKYFDLLKDYNVKLWHVFENKEDSIRLLPPGEWALFGGSDAGHRALVVGRFLGFRDIHVFGMDGCYGESGRHAAAHPTKIDGYSIAQYKGKDYRTTVAMAECVRQLPHELDQLDDVHATFHGEGLVQAMMADYVFTKKPKGTPSVGVIKPELISATYRDLNEQLHRDNLAYGIGGGKHVATVLKLADNLKTRSVLDYGCGKGLLAQALPFPIWEYDPAIPGKQESPRPSDLVVCTDVLEHIEPDKLPYVLSDLQRCVRQVGYFVIHTGPASKTLPDGRNTHLIQHGKNWWTKKLSHFFHVGRVIEKLPELHVIVGPKRKQP